MAKTFPSINFEEYHQRDLPQLLEAGRGAAAALGAKGVPSVGLRVTDPESAFTYVSTEDGIELLPGDEDAQVVVSLSRESWEGMVHDLESPGSLLYHGDLEAVRGDMMDFVRWEAPLRTLYTGRPIYDPENLDLRDRRGAPLDVSHGFSLDDDPEDMAHFLREAGYLLVKGAFSPEEVESFRHGAAELSDAAVPGDQKSWWGESKSGKQVLYRVLQAGRRPEFASLPDDPRLLKLIGLCDDKMESRGEESQVEGVSVLWKHGGMEDGLADLPWHRDCGLGGHAAMCPTVVASIFLHENTPEAGALRFLPGSWQAMYQGSNSNATNSDEGVIIPAEAGDVTLHQGDSFHAAPPPVSKDGRLLGENDGPFRSCLLVSFEREGAFNHREGEVRYNDVLLGDENGRVSQITKVASEI